MSRILAILFLLLSFSAVKADNLEALIEKYRDIEGVEWTYDDYWENERMRQMMHGDYEIERTIYDGKEVLVLAGCSKVVAYRFREEFAKAVSDYKKIRNTPGSMLYLNFNMKGGEFDYHKVVLFEVIDGIVRLTLWYYNDEGLEKSGVMDF